MCAGFSLKKTSTVFLSIGVRITMIRCVVQLLRIFEMFRVLMNNPVFSVLRTGQADPSGSCGLRRGSTADLLLGFVSPNLPMGMNACHF